MEESKLEDKPGWEIIFAKNTSDERLCRSKTHKELLKLYKKANTSKIGLKALTDTLPKKTQTYENMLHIVIGNCNLKQDATTYLLEWPKSDNAKRWYGCLTTLIHGW